FVYISKNSFRFSKYLSDDDDDTGLDLFQKSKKLVSSAGSAHDNFSPCLPVSLDTLYYSNLNSNHEW
ncbi:MAG: hypothetical protein VXZ87_04675, partial [Bacteroidota bacterium]|nr:hypothetical protein [Bacteroidota bacterium]